MLPNRKVLVAGGFVYFVDTASAELYTSVDPLVNISTRLKVLTGDNVLIGGFIVAGTTGTKQVLVRGLGPTLIDYGVTGVLVDPTLELHHRDNQGQDSIVATNDNWKQTQQTAIQATGKAPGHDSEAAILQTLVPGNYTAILAGKNSTTGIGLVEVYDQDPASTAQLSNISSRGHVGTGNDMMIGGFISAVADTTVIVRALGNTTAIVSGKNGPTGVALVEVYLLP